jgi:hypothetical protein
MLESGFTTKVISGDKHSYSVKKIRKVHMAYKADLKHDFSVNDASKERGYCDGEL